MSHASPLDTYVVTNKTSLKAALKITLSMVISFYVGVRMHFQHPTWVMITGLVTFYAPDHAQIIKKCLGQCLGTIGGGIVGVLILSTLSESPLMAGLVVAAFIFCCSTLSYATRDTNVTFCCAFFAVTCALMVMVTVTLGPTPDTVMLIFFDRVGTILAGIAVAGFVSATIFPVYSTDILRASSLQMVDQTLALCTRTGATDEGFFGTLADIYSQLIDAADGAGHSEFEGRWGYRMAQWSRELSQSAVDIINLSSQLHYASHALSAAIRNELQALAAWAEELRHTRGVQARHWMTESIRDRLQSWRKHAQTSVSAEDEEHWQILSHLGRHVIQLIEVRDGLEQTSRIRLQGLKIGMHLPLRNCLINGLRSAILFMLGFVMWHAFSWEDGFLVCVIPTVFGIMLAKIPHHEVAVLQLAQGLLFAILPGSVVFVLVAGAPSAAELFALTVAPFLFLALLGVRNHGTFPYTWGFCIAFTVFLLPQNVHDLDLSFAIQRIISVAMGAAVLSLLFRLLPRKPLIPDDTDLHKAFAPQLAEALNTPLRPRQLLKMVRGEQSAVLDKMIYSSTMDTPQRRGDIVAAGHQLIFLGYLIHLAYMELARLGISRLNDAGLRAWKREVMENYQQGTSCALQSLSMLARASDQLRHTDTTPRYLQTLDRLDARIRTVTGTPRRSVVLDAPGAHH